MLAGEIQTFSIEKRYVQKDGSLVWVHLTVALARCGPIQAPHPLLKCSLLLCKAYDLAGVFRHAAPPFAKGGGG